MGVKMSAIYQGEKHCELTHGPSGAKISTDAPKDNNGKGELFSPTDLVGAALGSCVVTVMAIVAEREGISLVGTKVDVEKEMVTEPQRRIGVLRVKVTMAKGIPQHSRQKLENTAHHCPVHKSLHPDIHAPIEFIYPD
jgi:putative redox protein